MPGTSNPSRVEGGSKDPMQDMAMSYDPQEGTSKRYAFSNLVDNSVMEMQKLSIDSAATGQRTPSVGTSTSYDSQEGTSSQFQSETPTGGCVIELQMSDSTVEMQRLLLDSAGTRQIRLDPRGSTLPAWMAFVAGIVLSCILGFAMFVLMGGGQHRMTHTPSSQVPNLVPAYMG